MKVLYRQAATDDIVRQFRYYLVEQDRPDIAVRFREAVRNTVNSLRARPFVGARYRSRNPELRSLRSWPVAGFEAIRIYYVADPDEIHVVRILHGKRDLRRVLEQGGPI
ncbi:MAG: type II toxin-antitoxin system RelE/ParE family toxin [Candidatus Sulfotelmatobacter sp.]